MFHTVFAHNKSMLEDVSCRYLERLSVDRRVMTYFDALDHLASSEIKTSGERSRTLQSPYPYSGRRASKTEGSSPLVGFVASA